MPMSSSAAFCCTLCQTASIVSATMASSPMATAPTRSLSVSGCSIAVTLVPASLPAIAAKAIACSPPTSQSVPIAAAPCGRSQPCRAPATLSHSPVTRHDCPADVYDHHAQPPRCGQQCLHRYRVANQSLSSGIPSVPALEINAIVAHSSPASAVRTNKPPSARSHRASSNIDNQRAIATIPIVLNARHGRRALPSGGRACDRPPRSTRLAWRQGSQGAEQYLAPAVAATHSRTQRPGKCLAVHAPELVVKPDLQILRRYRRPLLLRLEHAHRCAVQTS